MKQKVTIHSISIVMMLAIFLAGILFSPVQAFKSGDIPTPKNPYGYIVDTTPVYKWTKVTSATNYQLQLYRGATWVYTKTFGSAFCGTTTCQRTPADVLSLGKYKWKIRAKISGAWKDWSTFKYFELVEPSLSFNSNFNGSMKGWVKKGGGTWHVNDSYLYTTGMADNATNIYRTTGNYTNFTYEASMRRTVNGQQANYLCVRMGSMLDADKDWYPGYIFGYTNDGKISVWRYDSEYISTPIINWVATDDADPFDWNTVKVIANGSHFQYYLNGELQADFNDATYASGMVGFQMYTPGVPAGEFQVDWARLQTLP